jgi:hypothetical protein
MAMDYLIVAEPLTWVFGYGGSLPHTTIVETDGAEVV